MRREAEDRLEDYEHKLDRIDQELDEAKSQMRELAEVERERVLAEAKERRERMEREAKVLVDQELKAAREQLFRETVKTALHSSEESVKREIGPADHERIAEEYLGTLRQAATVLRGRL
jgi:F-type H+-transporting ATPase subunit b